MDSLACDILPLCTLCRDRQIRSYVRAVPCLQRGGVRQLPRCAQGQGAQCKRLEKEKTMPVSLLFTCLLPTSND